MEKGIWKFFFSKNKSTYIKIALKYRSMPWRVYNLAHGKRIRTQKDNKIVNDLLEEGIISEVKHW